MPLPLQKNPGPLLTSKRYGTLQGFPPEFIASVGVVTLEQQNPVDIEPFQIGSRPLLLESSVEQIRTDERKKTDIYLTEVPTGVLESEVKLDSGLIATRTRKLVPEGTPLAPIDGLTESGDQDNLGNGWLDQTIVEAPELFERYQRSRERPVVTPEDFRALLQERTEATNVLATFPSSIPPLGAGEISKTIEQIDVFKYRDTERFIDILALPAVNINFQTNRFKQVEQVSRFLLLDSTTPAVPTATRDTTFTKLGDGTALEVVTDVEEIFPQIRRHRERGIVTPEDFRALLQTTEAAANVTATFPSSIPALVAGEISKTAEQIDVFNYRATVVNIDLASLPAININFRTNQFKQVEQVSRSLVLDSTTPAVPTATRNVEFTKLGDGTALEVVADVEEVFENKTSAIERTDLVPEFFKALLPTYVVERTVEGIVVDPPVLTVGDLSKSETQIDVFNKKVTTRGRAGISYPQGPVVLLRHLGGMEFGGEVTRVVGLLDNTIPAVEEGLGIVSSEVRTLGNNTWFRQTEKWESATEWPELVGTEVDPRTGIVVEVKRQVVVAGTTGGISVDGYTDVKPIDKWRSLQIASKLDLTSIPVSRQWETTVEHSFPNTLNAAVFIWQSAFAPFAYDFDAALILDMTQGYAGPCRALVTESFSDGPPTDIVSITQFFPQGHTVGYTWGFAADLDDCDGCVGIAKANARTWPIPASLHDEIEVGLGVTITGGEVTDILPATVPIGLPVSGTLITKAVEVEPWRFNIFYRKMTQIYVP